MSLGLPPIYLLQTNLKPDELHHLEESIPSLTWDVREAEVVVGRITRRERALFELRRLKLPTKELINQSSDQTHQEDGPPAKRRRTDTPLVGNDGIRVVKLAWLTESLGKGIVLPMKDFTLYEGSKLPPVSEPSTPKGSNTSKITSISSARNTPTSAGRDGAHQRTPTGSASNHKYHSRPPSSPSRPPPLVRETTSEHEMSLPNVPQYLHTSYSCQRPTPGDSPNAKFIDELKEVRTLRLLEGDQVGVRAYSTSIASLSAYPYALQSSSEVSRLPGCGSKIAGIWQRWNESGKLCEVEKALADPRMCILKTFYEIWGVGDHTARDFYNKGWRDLDDIVEYGWNDLSRVQQIGVKYYDDFQLKIPRPEVEDIGAVIRDHCHRVDPGFQVTIVGGYRRGKAHSGDVDAIVSHPDENFTLRIIEKLVNGLERSQYITHTLALSTRNSEREQAPLPWKGHESGGTGFDTLDKAMVVWKDPTDEAAPYRRVDIIVSPWKTVGCAILGWSGGTTFQRDLRRYCKNEMQLKFDSSGVRRRDDGTWMDLESSDADGPAPDVETAEKRVFAGLGLEWVPPEKRCTG